MGKNHASTSERATVKADAGAERPSASAANSHRQSIIPPTIKKHYCDFLDHSGEGNSNRYKIGDLLGCGAFGQIYSAFDRNIGRKIAIKSPLPGAMQDKEKLDYFLHEAQITASLQHPNIMPIYDLDTDSNGRPYFTMRQIEGISLGEAIDRAAAGNVPPEIRTYASRVNIILKVLDAISYVHSCGIIHQDIKPDNIMLGKFGEVMVSDWGTASFATEYPEGRLIGTPLFMPPEQAQHRPVGVANDIYALGATLYNLLTWQYPMDDQDSDRFWDRKFNGVYNDLPPEIERDVPPVLLDIARKAMSVRIEDRYPSADAMARDLRRYLEGSPVSAHHDSVWEVIARNFRHHRRAMLVALLIVVLLTGLGGLLLRERQRRLSAWRLLPDVDISQLANDDLGDNWEERFGTYFQPLTETTPGGPRSAWHIRDGILYGRALTMSLTNGNATSPISNLTWGHNIFGGIRVELGVTPFDAPLNLNCFIAGTSREDSYVFHIGGWNDPLSCVLTRGKNLEWITESRLDAPLELYQEHDIRMEYDGGCVRLFINHKKIIEYHDSDPLNGIFHQTFGLETDSHARAVSDVRVYQKPSAEMVSPLEAADVLAYSGEFERAIDYYHDLLRNYPNAEYATLARYRIAACLDKLGRRDDALRQYREIIAKAPAKDPVRLNALITCGRIYLERSDDAKWLEAIDAIAAAFPGADASKQILDLYSTHLQERMTISSYNDPDSLPTRVRQCIQKVNDLNKRLGFGANPAGINYSEYAYRLWLAGYPDVCLELFPWRDYLRVHSLEQMGAYKQIAMESQKSSEHANALIFTGQISRAIATYPYFVAAYVAAGDFAAAWKHARTHSSRFWLLLLEGRFQEAQSIAEDAQEKFAVQALLSPDQDFIEVIDGVLNNGSEQIDRDTAIFVTDDLQSKGSRRLKMMQLLREALSAMESQNPGAIDSIVDNMGECFRDAPYQDFCLKNWSPEFGVLLGSLIQHAVGNANAAKSNLERLRQHCAATPYRYSYLLPHIEYLLKDSPPETFTGRTNTVLPHQQKAALLLAGAWKADLAGDVDTARRAYREWFEIQPQLQTRHYQHLPFLRRFVRLRLKALE